MTYELEELLGTKLRALYQRKKGHDLFDLAAALKVTNVDPARIVDAFRGYMNHEEKHVTRALFERSLAEKLDSPEFSADITPLLASGYTWDRGRAAETVSTRIIALLPGAPWKNRKMKSPKDPRFRALLYAALVRPSRFKTAAFYHRDCSGRRLSEIGMRKLRNEWIFSQPHYSLG